MFFETLSLSNLVSPISNSSLQKQKLQNNWNKTYDIFLWKMTWKYWIECFTFKSQTRKGCYDEFENALTRLDQLTVEFWNHPRHRLTLHGVVHWDRHISNGISKTSFFTKNCVVRRGFTWQLTGKNKPPYFLRLPQKRLRLLLVKKNKHMCVYSKSNGIMVCVDHPNTTQKTKREKMKDHE